ncbi:MAG: FAD-binding oxidoreductase, partial [Flavobacteriaceae bacterium]|nr:FAD-binding oxidoreductase [Flavobacteriaceae bacterium]
MAQFHILKVKSIVRKTKKAVSITFLVPINLKSAYTFKSGQYVTLKTLIDGAEVRRDYSLSSSPKSGDLTVTVKEIKNGLFSTHANNTLKSGDNIEVGIPNGRFVYEPKTTNRNSIVMFAAGSGITPIMSIIQTALESNTKNELTLIYGNKSPEKTIFYKELLNLQDRNPERFKIQFIYSESGEEDAMFGR